ncbi:putative reverse transcriptase zinc-binding domain-containing protein [Rosa chinensis]|uniref:Putative reverse transcriptase zinc-binding domain-containing protein n=1 Tax=Rosa chinensis TaxID=74649 RepID=A0A2P6PSE3_ROSCH|nr:putative reverse transcriptase zinc-binding domain-containing protein [Rosa chinensis]
MVGNGCSIDIWKDKWILNSELGYIRPIMPISPSVPSKVSNLIDWDSYTWNLQPILGLITESDMQEIKMQMFSDTLVEDKLIWPATKHGSYTVKSGYNLFHSLKFKPTGHMSHSSHRVNQVVWTTIWSIQTLPKIKHFLWQAVNNAISTYYNLFKRKIVASPICPKCGLAPETIEHIILLCPIAICTWFACSLNYKINVQEITSVDRWIEQILKLAGPHKELQKSCLTTISFIFWELWKSRCQFIYQATNTHPMMIASRAEKAALEFLKAKKHGHQLEPGMISNCTPSLSVPIPTSPFPIHTPNHTLSSQNPNIANLSHFFSRLMQPISSHSVTNTQNQQAPDHPSAILALSLAQKYTRLPIQIESDCQELVKDINGIDSGRDWRISPVIARIRAAPPPCRLLPWSWISRKANCAAHHIASLSVRKTCPDVWIDRPPSSLVHVLSRDGLPCPPPASMAGLRL